MIGVILENVNNDPITYDVFKCLNQLSRKHSCYLFTDSIVAMPVKNKFSILQSASAFEHRGVLIGTTLINAQMVNNSLLAKEKYLYLQNIDWMNINNLRFNQLRRVMHHPELKIIARGSNHYDIIKKAFKEPEHTIINWDAEELERAIL